MTGFKNLKTIPVWRQADHPLQNEAAVLWRKSKVLTEKEISKRRNELILVVVSEKTGELVGVSTAGKSRVKLFNNNWMYHYRIFVSPEHRMAGLDFMIDAMSFKILAEHVHQEPEIIPGVVMVYENKAVNNLAFTHAAVGRVIPVMFAGFDSRNRPIRVFYFKNARI